MNRIARAGSGSGAWAQGATWTVEGQCWLHSFLATERLLAKSSKRGWSTTRRLRLCSHRLTGLYQGPPISGLPVGQLARGPKFQDEAARSVVLTLTVTLANGTRSVTFAPEQRVVPYVAPAAASASVAVRKHPPISPAEQLRSGIHKTKAIPLTLMRRAVLAAAQDAHGCEPAGAARAGP